MGGGFSFYCIRNDSSIYFQNLTSFSEVPNRAWQLARFIEQDIFPLLSNSFVTMSAFWSTHSTRFFTFHQKLDRRKRVVVLAGLSGCEDSVEKHVDVVALVFFGACNHVITNFGNSLWHLNEQNQTRE